MTTSPAASTPSLAKAPSAPARVKADSAAAAEAKPTRTMRLPKGKRSTALLGVLFVVAGAALFALVATTVLGGDTVVVAARAIPAGTTISAEDLRAGQIRGDDVASVPGEQARTLLGTTAVGPIPAGALIAPDMVAEDPPPGPAQGAVGLNLQPGQLPAGQLEPGRHVSVLMVAPSDAAGGAEAPARSVLVENAEVLSATADPSGSWLVTISVPAGSAADVTAAAAVGRVAVVLLPVGA